MVSTCTCVVAPLQLGCQGLIVLDAAGRFATQRSPAFLDHRGAAFRAVEAMLTPLIATAAAAALHHHPSRSPSPTAKTAKTAKTTKTPSGGCTTDIKAPPASFSANACHEAPAPLDGDGDGDESYYALPPVDNAAMDADHAVIGGGRLRVFFMEYISSVTTFIIPP